MNRQWSFKLNIIIQSIYKWSYLWKTPCEVIS